jgi:hypothetical protein
MHKKREKSHTFYINVGTRMIKSFCPINICIFRKRGIEMQIMKNKKVWFFLLLGVMLMTTFCLWRSGVNETKAFANGRMVQRTGHAVTYFVQEAQSTEAGELA